MLDTNIWVGTWKGTTNWTWFCTWYIETNTIGSIVTLWPPLLWRCHYFCLVSEHLRIILQRHPEVWKQILLTPKISLFGILSPGTSVIPAEVMPSLCRGFGNCKRLAPRRVACAPLEAFPVEAWELPVVDDSPWREERMAVGKDEPQAGPKMHGFGGVIYFLADDFIWELRVEGTPSMRPMKIADQLCWLFREDQNRVLYNISGAWLSQLVVLLAKRLAFGG